MRSLVVALLALSLGRSVWAGGPAQSDPILMPTVTSFRLRYLGAIKVPMEVEDNAYGALVLRTYPNGTKTFIIVGRTTEGTNAFEFSNPGPHPNLSVAQRGTLVKAWGDIYQGHRTWPVAYSSGQIETEGLFWLGNKTLLWTYGYNYDVTGGSKPVVGITQFNSDGSISAFGPWQANVNSHRLRNYGVAVPSWFASAYTGGRTLALGAGIESGASEASFGPGLFAVDTPTSRTPTSHVLTTRELSFYPEEPYQHRFHRDTQYEVLNSIGGILRQPDDQFAPPRDGVGYWGSADFIRASTWIDLPDVQGVMFFGRLGYDDMWYGNSPLPTGVQDPCHATKGQHASHYAARWFIYAPADLAKVATRQVSSWQITPTEVFDPTVLFNMELNCDKLITGAAFDPDTRTLYVCAPAVDNPTNSRLPVIYAFAIR